MRLLVLGLATLALSAGAASAQQAVYPRYGYAPLATATLTATVTTGTITATTPTILDTTTVATGIATKRNLGSPRSTRGPRFMIRERSRMFVFQAWPRVVNNSRILVISGEDVALSPLNMRLAVADFAL